MHPVPNGTKKRWTATKSFATLPLQTVSLKRRVAPADQVDRGRIANWRNRKRVRRSSILECGPLDISGGFNRRPIALIVARLTYDVYDLSPESILFRRIHLVGFLLADSN